MLDRDAAGHPKWFTGQRFRGTSSRYRKNFLTLSCRGLLCRLPPGRSRSRSPRSEAKLMRGPRWSWLAARRLRIMAEPVLTPMRSSVGASACPKRRRGRFQFLVAAMWMFPFANPSGAAPSKSASVGGLILPQIQRLAAEASVTIDGRSSSAWTFAPVPPSSTARSISFRPV